MKKICSVLSLCLVLVLASVPAAQASYQRLQGLTVGISGVVADDTDFDYVNIAKLANLKKGKYIGELYAGNYYDINSNTTSGNYWTRESAFSFSNFFLFSLSDDLKAGIIAQPSNYVWTENNTFFDHYFCNDVYGIYGLAVAFAPAKGSRLGLSVLIEDENSPAKMDYLGDEFSDVFKYNGTIYELGMETDVSDDAMLGVQVRYETAGGNDEFRNSLGVDSDTRYSRNELFGMSLNGERKLDASTTLRGFVGFNNISKPYVEEIFGTESEGLECRRSNYVAFGLEYIPVPKTVTAAGFKHYDSANTDRYGSTGNDLYREAYDVLFAGVEAPVPGADKLILRGSVKGGVVSSANRGNTWDNYDGSVIVYAVGLGYRVLENVMVDFAANSSGSVPIGGADVWFSERGSSPDHEELSGAPQVTFAVMVDG